MADEITSRITITETIDENGELDLQVDVTEGLEFTRYLGMLEVAKLSMWQDEIVNDDEDD